MAGVFCSSNNHFSYAFGKLNYQATPTSPLQVLTMAVKEDTEEGAPSAWDRVFYSYVKIFVPRGDSPGLSKRIWVDVSGIPDFERLKAGSAKVEADEEVMQSNLTILGRCTIPPALFAPVAPRPITPPKISEDYVKVEAEDDVDDGEEESFVKVEVPDVAKAVKPASSSTPAPTSIATPVIAKVHPA